jgi:hypothetical protein
MPRKPRTTKAPTPASVAAELAVTERVLLFCVASDTDWSKVATHAAARHLIVRSLIEREDAAASYRLTPQGRAVLDVLVRPSPNEQDGGLMPRAGSITLDGKLYLTTVEGARRTGLYSGSIRWLIQRGRVAGRLHKTRWLVEEASLAAFVANREGRPKRGRPKKLHPKQDGP